MPVVRATGGLRDTVFDVECDKARAAWEMEGSSDCERDNLDATNGFSFEASPICPPWHQTGGHGFPTRVASSCRTKLRLSCSLRPSALWTYAALHQFVNCLAVANLMDTPA